MMKEESTLIRTASAGDAAALLRIYTPYVEKTAITFEYEAPGLSDFAVRIENTLKKYPYLVAERDGAPLGYAYTGPFHTRAAYAFAAETTIYLSENERGAGLGKRLYLALEAVSRAQNLLNLNACIAYPETEDAHLTKNSALFHAHMGYDMVGAFHQCGFKFGTWYNMVWMEKRIGPHTADPAPFIPFPALGAETLQALGIRR